MTRSISLYLAALAAPTLVAHAQIVPPGDRPIRPPIIMPPRPWPQPLPRETALVLTQQKAEATIKNGLARVKLTQTFRNPLGHQTEGTYLWTLPRDAAISDFAMTVDGKKLNAEILKSENARKIYDDIVRSMRDPAILEFVDRDLVRVQIFPIPANGLVEVELVYSQPLTNRFALPLRQPQARDPQNAKTSVQIELEIPNLNAVTSPSHEVEVKRTSSGAVVSGEWNATASDSARDFSLFWTRGTDRVALDALTYRDDTEKDGYFLLLAAPDDRFDARELQYKDVVFVFDTSGSMAGEKIEQARGALRTLLGNLQNGDRFNIVTFSSEARTFRSQLVPANTDNLQAAQSFVDGIRALGGTNIEDALQTAFKQTAAANVIRGANIRHVKQIVFLTDGQPTVGETRVEKLLQTASDISSARLWTFGVGFDVNARLLDALAEENRGAADYVLPNENIEQKVGELYSKIAFPVLTNLQIEWPGAEISEIYPRRLPDLFKGGQMVVTGRFRRPGNGPIMLRGQIGDQKHEFKGRVSDEGSRDVARLWATRKVGFLIADARRDGRPLSDEVRDEILAFSKRFGIVTPLTAALITEDERRSPNFAQGDSGTIFGTPQAAGSPAVGARTRMLGDIPIFSGLFRDEAAAEAGRDAVMASKATQELQQGRAQNVAGTKTLGGKTFVLRGNVWTDLDYDAQKLPNPRVVKFASDEYFALAQDKTVAQWLSAGEKVLFVRGGEAIRVE